MVFGIQGFFVPRMLPPYFAPDGSLAALSLYDTEPLRATLNKLVDFDYIKTGGVRLSLGSVNVGTAESVYSSLSAPNYLLKIIPHVDGSPRICELVRYYMEDITLKGAWEGPAALELFHHALAPVASLPVLEVLGGVHYVTDVTLGLGTVIHDYLAR